MKSIIDDTDAIGARLKDIEGTSVPEPTPAHESSSVAHLTDPVIWGYDWADEDPASVSQKLSMPPYLDELSSIDLLARVRPLLENWGKGHLRSADLNASASHVAHQYDPDLMVYGWVDEDPA